MKKIADFWKDKGYEKGQSQSFLLQFLVDNENENLKKKMEISIQAGEIVGKLYDEILPLYINQYN